MESGHEAKRAAMTSSEDVETRDEEEELATATPADADGEGERDVEDERGVDDDDEQEDVARQCSICEITIAAENAQFEFCEGGCEICEECCFADNVREVLLEQEVETCIICDAAPVLPGRTNPELFDRYTTLVFRPAAAANADDISGADSSASTGSKRSGSKRGKKSTDRTARTLERGDDSARSRSSNKSSARKTKPLPQDPTVPENETPGGLEGCATSEGFLGLNAEDRGSDGTKDGAKYSFSFSGGVVDVRYHDLETVFAQNPIESKIEIREYRRVKNHALIKMLRVMNGEICPPGRRQRRGSVSSPPVQTPRKIPMRLLIPELNEILGQWIRKSKEVGKAIDLPEFVHKFAIDQYGIKTMADEHLNSLISSLQAYESQSDRVSVFWMVLGLSNPELNTPLLSEVLFTLVSLLFESSRDWRESLDMGDGASWVPHERVGEMIVGLFDPKSRAWLLDVAHEDCVRLKTPLPWNASARKSFEAHLEGLATDPSELGISRAKARHVEQATRLDAVLKFALVTWLKEWARTLSHLQRVEAEFRSAEQREVQIRADIRKFASERPFGPQEKELLWALVEEVLQGRGRETMPRDPDAKAWQLLLQRNQQRRDAQLPFLRNRSVGDLYASYRQVLKEHQHREALRWNFNRWDWDEDWEWGGLALIAEQDLDEAPTQRQEQDATRNRHDTGPAAKKVPRAQAPGLQTGTTKSLLSSATTPSLLLATLPRPQLTSLGGKSSVSSGAAFNFGYFAVGSRHANTVIAALSRYPHTATRLCLRENQFDDAACAAVVAAVGDHHQVSSFDLSCNLAGSATAAMLASQFKAAFATHLTVLNLASNRLDNDAMVVALEALSCHKAIRELNIAGNGLGASPALARALATLACTNRKGACSISVLDISWNQLRGADVIPLFEELAANNRCLHVLKLDLNRIDASAADALERCLHTNTTLQRVTMAHNKLQQIPADARVDASGGLAVANQCQSLGDLHNHASSGILNVK